MVLPKGGGVMAEQIPPTIRKGDRGSVVAKWQSIVGVSADGAFGPKTEAATIAWQRRNGLAPDGVVGPLTWGRWFGLSSAPDPSGSLIFPFVQAKYFNVRPARAISLIVIHTMEWGETPKTAASCAQFFTDPKRKDVTGAIVPAPASAHLCVDNFSTVQCVAFKDIAWHTPGRLGGDYVNNFSIGIEHAGFARQTAIEWADDYSTAMLARSAGIVAKLCTLYGIAPIRLSADDLKAGKVNGITGHVDCTNASGSGSHWDPGPSFPWSSYIARVEAAMNESGVAP